MFLPTSVIFILDPLISQISAWRVKGTLSFQWCKEHCQPAVLPCTNGPLQGAGVGEVYVLGALCQNNVTVLGEMSWTGLVAW